MSFKSTLPDLQLMCRSAGPLVLSVVFETMLITCSLTECNTYKGPFPRLVRSINQTHHLVMGFTQGPCTRVNGGSRLSMCKRNSEPPIHISDLCTFRYLPEASLVSRTSTSELTDNPSLASPINRPACPTALTPTARTTTTRRMKERQHSTGSGLQPVLRSIQSSSRSCISPRQTKSRET